MDDRCGDVPLAEQAGSLITLLDRELGRDEAVRFRGAPLTAVQFSIADALAGAGSLTLGGLAATICCVPANVTGLVDRLERKGYVERLAAPGDRRVTRVALTAAGERALVETRSRVAGRYSRLGTALSEDELGSLVATLGSLYLELTGSGGSGCRPGSMPAGDPAKETR